MMIKETVYEYWQSQLPSIKPRDFDFGLVDLDLINDIVGIRRAGKTYLIFYIIQKLLEIKRIDKRATLYINFENRKLYPLKEKYFNQIIELIYSESLLDKNKKVYLFLGDLTAILLGYNHKGCTI